MRSYIPARVEKGDKVAFSIDPAVAPPDIANHMNLEGLKKWARRLKPSSGVVVASDDDRGHFWPRVAESNERVVKERLGFAGRILAIEDITSDDQCIDVPLDENFTEPVESFLLLMLTREAPQGLPDVPVAGVDDAHDCPRSVYFLDGQDPDVNLVSRHMNERPQNSTTRYSVAERLRFIDAQLFWHARINRSDLIKEFRVSPAQAAADFKDYLALSANGVRYDTRTKAYVASNEFEPVFGWPDASLALHAMWEEGDPLLAELAPLERPVDARMAARLRRAARDRKKVHVRYQSFTRPRLSWRWIAPARLVSDGQRWHVRAWCFRDMAWKDFVLARILELSGAEAAEGIPVDRDWIDTVELVLAPAAHLSEDQKASVGREYGMSKGQLRMTVPRALKIYALRRWGLDRPDSRLALVEA